MYQNARVCFCYLCILHFSLLSYFLKQKSNNKIKITNLIAKCSRLIAIGKYTYIYYMQGNKQHKYFVGDY